MSFKCQDPKFFDEKGKELFKRELVKLEIIQTPTEVKEINEELKKIEEEKTNNNYINF